MNKKSQAAMEFLMTYGWAILVVIIAIGALAYFGVMSPEQFLPEKCIISTGSGLFCREFATSSADDKITLRLHNILTDSVDIVSITTDNPACSAFTCTPDPIPADTLANCELSCSAGLTAKDKIKVSISLTYKVGDSGLEKGTSGSLTTIVP